MNSIILIEEIKSDFLIVRRVEKTNFMVYQLNESNLTHSSQ